MVKALRSFRWIKFAILKADSEETDDAEITLYCFTNAVKIGNLLEWVCQYFEKFSAPGNEDAYKFNSWFRSNSCSCSLASCWVEILQKAAKLFNGFFSVIFLTGALLLLRVTLLIKVFLFLINVWALDLSASERRLQVIGSLNAAICLNSIAKISIYEYKNLLIKFLLPVLPLFELLRFSRQDDNEKLAV